MANYQLEKQIASKIIELSEHSVVFIENEYRKLTPAGKYQACLLTGAMVIQLLQSKNIFNPNNGANVKSIISILEDDFQLLFAKYRDEYQSNGQKIEKYGSDYLDTLNKIGNDILIKRKTEFIKSSVEIGISHLWDDLDKYQKGFERFNSGTGKAVMPELTFISLYIYPFFLSLVPNSEKPETCYLISDELKNVHRINDFDFMLIPAKLSSHLSNLINKDANFVASLIKVNRPISRPASNTASQKGCYVATLAYQDIDHPKVEYLRKYRDNRLSKTESGKKFIELYYQHSPKIVEFLKPYKKINKLIRNGLDFLILILKRTE